MNMWEYNKRSNFCAIEVSDREEKTGGVEKVTEKMCVKKTPNLGRHLNIQIQETKLTNPRQDKAEAIHANIHNLTSKNQRQRKMSLK